MQMTMKFKKMCIAGSEEIHVNFSPTACDNLFDVGGSASTKKATMLESKGKVCEVVYPPCGPPIDCSALRKQDPGAKCPEVQCEPIRTCIEQKPVISCATVRCATETTCQMVAPPCVGGELCEPSRPECIPICTKKCRQGFKCESSQPPCPAPVACLDSESLSCTTPTCPYFQRCTDLRPKTCDKLQCSGGKECQMITDTCGRRRLCRKKPKAECVPVCNKKCGRNRECKLTSRCPLDGSKCKHTQKCKRKPGICPKCRPGKECALRQPRCARGRKCKARFVCVRSRGKCPRPPTKKPGKNSYICKRERRRSHQCVNDSHCRTNQKCCTSKCGRKICMRPKRR
ncbi:spore coat protein SP60 [Aplysia californica]|uniref:Spore coat protein SP60 n=1 Tax=Aplysia californica TaxID=6500 RepID=A0ABM0ZV97_APLCA|nr:spore coat protein SP60 [Aplysia californica]